MSTIYTLNGKVLKNAANDKWLAKKEAPAGFVMNASNATYTAVKESIFVSWQAPSYPDAYNGDGKQYRLVNNNSEATNVAQLMYTSASNPSTGGPSAISKADMQVLGTSTGVLVNNVGYPAYGVLFVLPLQDMTLEQAQVYMANLTITILDP
jgi:hypothetical protein